MENLFDAEINITWIGRVENDCGSDEYALLVRKDGDLTAEQARDLLLLRVYQDTDCPGGYFCHNVDATQRPFTTNEVIVIVYHRYDI